MTSTVTQSTLTALSTGNYEALSSLVGVTIVVVVVMLLLFRELASILRVGRPESANRLFDAVLLPLLSILPVLVLARLLELLG